MLSQPSLDLVQLLVRERLQQAANDALAHQVSLARPSLRPRLAHTLRDLAIRLDPTLRCEPALATLSPIHTR
jgi:hypothetical protein